MPSLVWEREPQDAFEDPYEYEAQEQFAREADRLLRKYYRLLNSDAHAFTREDKSVKKAVWLLQMDALDSLRDCLDALQRKRHRIAGTLFRNVLETLDLAAYFSEATSESKLQLENWYSNKVIPHSKYREHLKRTQGKEAQQESSRHYKNLSDFTHRTYRALLQGYVLGKDNQLFHDGYGSIKGQSEDSETIGVLPQTIAMYYAAFANLILIFSAEVIRRELISISERDAALRESLEAETVPHRFMSREQIVSEAKNRNKETRG